MRCQAVIAAEVPVVMRDVELVGVLHRRDHRAGVDLLENGAADDRAVPQAIDPGGDVARQLAQIDVLGGHGLQFLPVGCLDPGGELVHKGAIGGVVEAPDPRGELLLCRLRTVRTLIEDKAMTRIAHRKISRYEKRA
jgi:hypothetical protein